MPRPSKGARIWYDKTAKLWLIRDGSAKRGTGCGLAKRARAEEELAEDRRAEESQEYVLAPLFGASQSGGPAIFADLPGLQTLKTFKTPPSTINDAKKSASSLNRYGFINAHDQHDIASSIMDLKTVRAERAAASQVVCRSAE